MATRDSAATRRRILEAATGEFAEHGLAGARVDQIAARAGANKQLIYAYFGNKEGLFDSALEASLVLMLDAVPFTADDLPAYAGALFDFVVANPQLARLVRWHQLERPGVMNQLPQTTASTERKLDALAAAQKAGTISAALPADQLHLMMLALVEGAAETQISSTAGPSVQRETLITSVQRLTSPE